MLALRRASSVQKVDIAVKLQQLCPILVLVVCPETVYCPEFVSLAHYVLQGCRTPQLWPLRRVPSETIVQRVPLMQSLAVQEHIMDK